MSISSELEPFCILALRQKGRACEALIQQVLSNKKIFVFGELLSLPSVAALRDSEYVKSFKCLELFAYGTYMDYVANPGDFIELTDAMRMKLRQLTIVSLAEHNKIIPYSDLQRHLEIEELRELEDLIIETINAGLVTGKLDQKKGNRHNLDHHLNKCSFSPIPIPPLNASNILAHCNTTLNNCFPNEQTNKQTIVAATHHTHTHNTHTHTTHTRPLPRQEHDGARRAPGQGRRDDLYADGLEERLLRDSGVCGEKLEVRTHTHTHIHTYKFTFTYS